MRLTLEELIDITNKTECIDGQTVHIISSDMDQSIKRLYGILNPDNIYHSFIKKLIEFILHHNELRIALSLSKYGLLDTMLVYNYCGRMCRVTIQNAHCLNCDWKGHAASPMQLDLYIGLDNKFEIMNEISSLPFLQCPKCGSKISTEAIWLSD